MLDEREGEVAPHELHRAFNRQGVGRRSAIVVAGPLANFLLAIVLYWGVFLAGSDELLPILGTPSAGSPRPWPGPPMGSWCAMSMAKRYGPGPISAGRS